MRKIILINIFGADKSGIVASIAGILAKYQFDILDIGQTVIHDTLSLGILAEVGAEISLDSVTDDITQAASRQDLQAQFQSVTEDEYQYWVSQQGKPIHIVTMLAQKLTAHQMARLSDVVTQSGLVIDQIRRLSGRISLDQLNSNQNIKSCVEISVRGDFEDVSALRAKFLELAGELDVDIAYQEADLFRRNRRLVAFDMDSTLIEAEVIDELAKEAGVGEQVAAITERAMLGEIDFNDSFKQRVGLLKGLDESVLEQVASRLVITEGAEKLISTLKKLGYRTAILSGGFTYFGRYLQDKLGIDYVYANELEIKAGKVTGDVKGEIVDGKRKATLLQEIAGKENLALEQVIAVGDGANDLPMLSIAGLGVAFRAKPLVKQSAKQAISTHGLDGILYLLGLSDKEMKKI